MPTHFIPVPINPVARAAETIRTHVEIESTVDLKEISCLLIATKSKPAEKARATEPALGILTMSAPVRPHRSNRATVKPIKITPSRFVE